MSLARYQVTINSQIFQALEQPQSLQAARKANPKSSEPFFLGTAAAEVEPGDTTPEMASTSDEEFDPIDQQHVADDTAADELKPSSATAVVDGEDLGGQQSDDSLAETSLEGTEKSDNHPPFAECETKPTSTPMDETKNGAGLGATESHMHSLGAQVEQATGFSRTEEPANYPPQVTNYQTNPNTPFSKELGEEANPDCPH